MVILFGVSIAIGPGNLQVVKKVVVTVGRFELGFTPYRLHKNTDGTFVTPIRVYDRKVYVVWPGVDINNVDR